MLHIVWMQRVGEKIKNCLNLTSKTVTKATVQNRPKRYKLLTNRRF